MPASDDAMLPADGDPPDPPPATVVADPDVIKISDDLVRFVVRLGRDKTTFDDLRRRWPEWFVAGKRCAPVYENVVLCTDAAPGFAGALLRELDSGGRLLVTRGYFTGGLWQRLPITRERERSHRTSRWWPICLTRRRGETPGA